MSWGCRRRRRGCLLLERYHGRERFSSSRARRNNRRPDGGGCHGLPCRKKRRWKSLRPCDSCSCPDLSVGRGQEHRHISFHGVSGSRKLHGCSRRGADEGCWNGVEYPSENLANGYQVAVFSDEAVDRHSQRHSHGGYGEGFEPCSHVCGSPFPVGEYCGKLSLCVDGAEGCSLKCHGGSWNGDHPWRRLGGEDYCAGLVRLAFFINQVEARYLDGCHYCCACYDCLRCVGCGRNRHNPCSCSSYDLLAFHISDKT